MPRKIGIRVHGKISAAKEQLVKNQSVCLLSVDGTLQSIYPPEFVTTEPSHRSTGYTQIGIGKPIVVRYLHHYLFFPEAKTQEEQIMISTFVKTIEGKKPAAEAITYYSPNVIFENKVKSIRSFGADNFGHELIYYSKSYTGQPIKMTTKVMELDNYDDVFKAISEGTERLGNVPFFVEYIPYMAMAKSSVNFISKLFKLIDKDDPIIPRLALDLFYDIPNMPKLQSGRIVCVHKSKLAQDEFISKGYKLNSENILVNSDGESYSDSSYFVVQVNSESRPEYEDFEYHQNAAELLAMTNRNADIGEFINTAVQGFRTYSDISTIEELESMQYQLDTPKAKEIFKALFKTMSTDVQNLYFDKYREMLERENL
jgi:hypothetical protein